MTPPYDWTTTYPPKRRVWPWALAAAAMVLVLVLCGIGLAAEDDTDDPDAVGRFAQPIATTTTPATREPVRIQADDDKRVTPTPKPKKAKASPKPARTSSKPVPRPQRTTTRPKATKPAATRFRNCTALRAVHPGGVPAGHPAYERRHDRDNDGHACEVN